MIQQKFFKVEVEHNKEKWFVYAPSSVEEPFDHTVMFVTERFTERWTDLLSVSHCLIFWPMKCQIAQELEQRHHIVACKNPRLEYARFFRKNHIQNLPQNGSAVLTNGSYIADGSRIGSDVTIMPGAYIGQEVMIGSSVYIGSGVRLIGKIKIGSNVVIRENTVLGADGLSMEREEDGRMIPIPQFGGVCVDDNVSIGANVTIARGAIDDTVIGKGSMIDNNCFISHNVKIGENVGIVGETILFGSVRVGKNSFISGNTAVRDGRSIGEHALVGMGGVVTKDVQDHTVVMGNPAGPLLERV